MINSQSPLETLAAFAISFAAGALMISMMAGYGKWMRYQGAKKELG